MRMRHGTNGRMAEYGSSFFPKLDFPTLGYPTLENPTQYKNITSKGILIAGAYGGTEIFRKFSNINNLQCGQVVCYVDIPLFGQLFFGDSRPFTYPNSSVVSRGKIRIFFR